MTDQPVAQTHPDDLHALTLVISAPRTGSTLLCRDLASLGGFGSPREYFRGFDGVVRRSATVSEADVHARLAAGVQADAPGVGAVKLMVQQSRWVAQALVGAKAPVPAAEAVSTVVRWARERFDHVMVVVLVRNTLDTAISRAVAEATGVYHSTNKRYRTQGGGVLDGVDINQKIMAELQPALRDRRTLQAVAQEHAATALLVTYDELTTQVEETTRRLLDHARANGFAPHRETPRRRLSKVISAERGDALRRSFLDFLATEPGQ